MMADLKKKKNFRKRRHSSSSDDNSEDDVSSSMTIEDTKEIQKLRKKTYGLSASQLADGKEFKVEEKGTKDPFKMKTGGYVDMKTLKKTEISEEDMEAIGTTFAAETNRRDEDTDMLKYVEDELAKRKGIAKQDEKKERKSTEQEDFLYELPEHIKALSSKKRNEDMLSNQMLSGIPEVDLGIEAKIKNIEVTEEAKQRLAQERLNKKDAGVSFVPTNMAVNFVQHNRYNIEDNRPNQKKTVQKVKVEPVRVGDTERPASSRPGTLLNQTIPGLTGQKATDDFHYEKFKKQLRRY